MAGSGADVAGGSGGVEVTGLREFRKALKAMHPRWPQALADVHKQIAEQGAEASRFQAYGMGGVQRKAADGIRGIGNMREARIGVSGGISNAAFWGAKKRTGWYANPRYRVSGAPNLPQWVGNSWEPAVAGQGPYAINDALAAYMPRLMDEYADMIEKLSKAAFPEGD